MVVNRLISSSSAVVFGKREPRNFDQSSSGSASSIDTRSDVTLTTGSAGVSSKKDGLSLLLACSAKTNTRPEHQALFNGRKLCEDRRGFFDQFSPKFIARSVVRTVVMQGSVTMSNYLNDQLKMDLDRDTLVDNGKMTRVEADEAADEWSEREWLLRWKEFPQKFAVSLAKYHSVIMIMRIYEAAAATFVDEVYLDKLTIDTFESAKRQNTGGNKHSNDKMSYGREMLSTTWHANMISYMADYSLHQIILLFGYYVYIAKEQRKRLKSQSSEISDDGEPLEPLHAGSITLSFLRKSTLLAISRIIGLVFASVGGAIGSTMLPGWGTLIGTNLGDGLSITFTEEMVSSDVG